MNENIKNQIREYKLIAIVRKIYGRDLLNLSQALYDGGIRLMEITFDQSDSECIEKTSNAISMLDKQMKGKLAIGAGTVLTVAQVEAAYSAGASYIVSPNTNENIIRSSKQKGLVSMPGAMTPTEMINAHEFGADFVKVFPVNFLGLKYMKSVLAPVNHIEFVATGGVSIDNLAEILNSGFIGAGIGGSLTDRKLIANKDLTQITDIAKKLVEIAENKKLAS